MAEYSVHYKLRLAIEVDVRQDWVGSEAEAMREVEALGRSMIESLTRPMYPICRIYAPVAERRRRRSVGSKQGQHA